MNVTNNIEVISYDMLGFPKKMINISYQFRLITLEKAFVSGSERRNRVPKLKNESAEIRK